MSAGMFSFERTLQVAPIFLQLIEDTEINQWRLSYSELHFFLSPQESFPTTALWQNWEILNVYFRCLKSVVFSRENMSFTSLHAGAEFALDMSMFEKSQCFEGLNHPRKTDRGKTDSVHCKVTDCTKMYHSSPSGDACICYRGDDYHYHEVHQYKHRNKVIAISDLEKELDEGASSNDIFVCFATSKCDIPRSGTPRNCALVHQGGILQSILGNYILSI